MIRPANSSKERPSESARLPKRVGGFEIERELGRGNNGVVYLARRPGLERSFALKVLLHTASLGDEARKRFRLEAQIGSKLSHPGVVSVYDIGEVDDTLFFAMDYVPGENLEERLERLGPLSPSEAARLIRDVAETMAYAHEQQVVHRDLKPGNILLSVQGGRPKITDFGLARDRELAESMTKSGDILGTPFYMAPEQLQGSRVGAQADVYALGVILYQCLTGRRPFEAKTPFDLAKKVMAGQCTPPSKLRQDVPAALEAICLQALAVDLRARTPSAIVLARQLEDFIGGRPVQGLAPSRRSRTLLLAAGGAVLLGVLASVLVTIALTGGDPPPTFAERFAAARAAPPADDEGLLAALRALEELEPSEAERAQARRWVSDWQAIYRTDAALAREALGEAKGAFAELGQDLDPALDPALDAARAARRARIERRDRLEALEAECRGRKLSGEMLGRWRALRSQARDEPSLAARTQTTFLQLLSDRQLSDVLSEELQAEGTPSPEHWRFEAACLRFEQSHHEVQHMERFVGEGQGVPRALRLAAAAELETARGRVREAILLYRSALQLEPELFYARLHLAVSLEVVGERSECSRLLAELERARPDSISRLVRAIQVRVARQEGASAVEDAERVLRLTESPSEQALAAAGIAAHVARRWELSERILEDGRRRYPTSSKLAFLRGLSHQAKGDEKRALQEYVSAYKRDAKGFELAVKELLAENGRRLLETVAAAAAGRPQQTFGLPLGQLSATARKRLQERCATIASPKAAEHALRAMLRLALGSPFDATVEGEFQAARTLAPDDPALAFLEAECLLLRDRLPAAKAALDRCQALGVDPRQVALRRADLLTRAGFYAKSREAYALVAAQGPKDGVWRAAQANVDFEETNSIEAVERSVTTLGPLEQNGRFELYVRIRASFHSTNRRHLQEAIRVQFEYEGLLDSATLTFYCMEQSLVLESLKGPTRRAMFEHLAQASTLLCRISEGAWPRVALAQITLVRLPKSAWVLGWIGQRLDEAIQLEPRRPRTYLLKGVQVFLARRPASELVAYWRKAVECGIDLAEVREWIERFGEALEGVDLSEFKR